MIDIKNRKQIQILLFVFIGVITLGVGYAAINTINFVISVNSTASTNQSNFSVKFKSATLTSGTGTATITNDTTATISVTGLTKVGDTATATYTIKNESLGVGADISLQLSNSNTEYFKVTETINDKQLQVNEQTTATITVEMIKTPIISDVTTTITGTLHATPIDKNSATGSASASITSPNEYVYILNDKDYQDSVYIGQAIPNNVTTYTNYQDVLNEYGGEIFIKLRVINNTVTEAYLANVNNGNPVYLRGGVTGSEMSQVMSENESIITSLSYHDINGSYIIGRNSNWNDELYIETSNNIVGVYMACHYLCYIEGNGKVWCERNLGPC